MSMFRIISCVLAVLMAVCQPAAAQWQTPNHSVPTGRGAGAIGFGSAAPGALGNVLTSNGPGTDPSFQPLLGYVRTRDYVRAVLPGSDGVCDGTTDATTQIQAAVTAAEGKLLLVEGVCAVSASINVPTAGLKIFSANRYKNGFILAAGANVVTGILLVNGNVRGNLTVDELYFAGNAVVTSLSGTTGAIMIATNNTSTTDFTDITIQNSYFVNFKQNYYIWFVHAAQVDNLVNIRRIKVINNAFFGDASVAPATVGNSFIRADANSTITAPTETGSIFDVEISGNAGYGIGVCGMLQGIGGIHDVTIAHNRSYGMGNNVDKTLPSYTYMLYQSGQTGNTPSRIAVTGNTSFFNHNFALYLAGVSSVAASGNTFTDTFRPNAAASLPWGSAIALNGCANCSVTGNTLTNNYGGVAVLGGSNPPGTNWANAVSSNIITSSLNALPSASAAPWGIWISGNFAPLNAINQQTNINGNIISMTGDIPVGIVYNGLQMGPLNVASNQIASSYLGYWEGSAYVGYPRTFSNNVYRGLLSNSPFIASSSAVPLTITGDTVDFSGVVSGAANSYIVDGSTKLTINGLTLRDKTTGLAAFSAVGAQGSIQNVRFPGTASVQVVATSLGLAKPTFPAEIGANVQNLAPAVIGTTPNSYAVKGWMNLSGGTAWFDDRTGLQ